MQYDSQYKRSQYDRYLWAISDDDVGPAQYAYQARQLGHNIKQTQRGRIEEIGPAQTVLSHPTSAYTRTLLAAVPRIEAVAEL